MTPQVQRDIHKTFTENVNMTAREIEDFLKTEESKSVGQTKSGESESIGHQSGRKIVQILRKNKSSLDDHDYDHMKKVNSYIARHLAQGGPTTKDVTTSAWRYSLMNWGHDPCK